MTLPEGASYFSAFGGLWPDRSDAHTVLEEKIRTGSVDAIAGERLRHWIEHGWITIDAGVEPALLDAYSREIDRILTTGNDELKVIIGRTNALEPLSLEKLTPENSVRILDHYVYSECVRELTFAPAIRHFLELLFEEPPLLFQSLGFEYGSQQGIHQDTAYVVVDSPVTLVGVWIAVEDVQEGAGELEYYDGSHRLPEYRFGGGKSKHYNPEEDGAHGHNEWERLMHENARKMNLARLTFRPRKGDVLFWHADLAHGGKQIARPGTTRRSLVAHYCPVSVTPHYFKVFPPSRAVKAPYDGCSYCSFYYEIP